MTDEIVGEVKDIIRELVSDSLEKHIQKADEGFKSKKSNDYDAAGETAARQLFSTIAKNNEQAVNRTFDRMLKDLEESLDKLEDDLYETLL